MTSISAEVFPVTLVSRRPMLIRVQPSRVSPALMLSTVSHNHPNESVLRYLQGLFASTFDPFHTIVHSTSWRYEAQQDRLLLTYLAVLPQGTWLDQWLAVDRISVDPIGGRALHGDQHLPPSQITWSAVLAHALDHLASLYSYDQSIQAALDPAWDTILARRQPKPAGCLQRVPSPLMTIPS